MIRTRVKKIIGIILVSFLGVSSIVSLFASSSVIVTFQIVGGSITIGAPTNLNFTSPLTASLITGTLTQAFNTAITGYFYVLDVQGADTGYDTTLAMSGMFNASGVVLSGGYVTFKSDGPAPVTLSGSTNNNVYIDSAATGGYQSLHTAKNWIRRNAGANTGVMGQYGQYIDMQLTIPAGQPAGSYQGTLVYTFVSH